MSVNSFIMYSLKNCPYCEKAVQLIEENDADLFFKFDEKHFDKQNIKDNVSKLVGKPVTTFPIIFTLDMEFIGGYDDLQHYFHKKELHKIVNGL